MKLKLILICLLLITACGKKDDDKLEREIYKGTQGVVLEVSDSALPQEVYEYEELHMLVKLVNKGAYPSTNTRLVIGVEEGYMEFVANNANTYELRGLDLEGKTTTMSFDDIKVREILIRVNEIDDLSEYHDAYIITTLCYDYGLYAFADVCVDTDPYGVTAREKTCTVQESISMSEGQGGPVIVERIEPKMLTTTEDNNALVRPQFKIYLANKGRGTPYSPGFSEQVCSQNSLNRDTYNTINLQLELTEFKNSEFECYPKEVILRGEKDFITCTLKSGGIPKDEAGYLTPLKITLNYGYTETISKEIKIKKILRY